MAQQPTIRRATPLDVVNLYRLASEQGEFDRFGPSDEARALAFVLDVIQNGYVLVAETKAKRVVATIGFACFPPPTAGEAALQAQWLAVAPSYEDGSLAADLLDLTVRAADKGCLAVHLSLSLGAPLDDEALGAAGFKPSRVEWMRQEKKNKNGVESGNERDLSRGSEPAEREET